MKTPNFFIIGAPKCGTTSLATWLSEHSHIYMSPVKEPHHFNTDDKCVITPNRHDYEQLFKGANDLHVAIGEASVWYLSSNEAVPNIEQYTSCAKYIVCLRNPVEMAYSLHEQLIVSGHECEPDFAIAWGLQQKRSNGEMIPKLCWDPRYLAYGPVCSLGEQLERVYASVPKERVLPILLDDVKLDPRVEYLRILRFLNAEDDGRSDFSVMNSAKGLRSTILLKAIRILGDLKRSFGIRHGFGILNAIDRGNIRYRARAPMSIDMVRTLECYFLEDVEKLGRLIDRDLSHWLNNSQADQTQKKEVN